MILLLIGGILLTGISVVVLTVIFGVLRQCRRAVEECGIIEQLPVYRQKKPIVAAWSLVLVVGLIQLWLYFR